MALEARWGQQFTQDLPVRVLGRRGTWRRKCSIIALVGDVSVALFVATLVQVLHPEGTASIFPVLAISLVWLAFTAGVRSYDRKLFGEGVEEYRRVFLAGISAVAAAGVLSALLAASWGQMVVFGFGALTLLTLVWRWILRRSLHRRRRHGRGLNRALLVGPADQVGDLVTSLNRSDYDGTKVVAALVPNNSRLDLDEHELEAVVVGSDIADTARQTNVDEVILIGGTRASDMAEIRDLIWSLAEEDIALLIAPLNRSATAPRLHLRPVDGLPLLHVAEPQIDGLGKSIKAGLDRVLALLGLVFLAPVLAVVAVLIRIGSPGPVIFKQTRIGFNGEPFTMYKFRTMVPDAETKLVELRDANVHTDTGTLFKVKQDPRVTPIGRKLRKFSLDELPQLYNVLKGDMSLVGPRPPLPEEVANYPSKGKYRMAVRPGLTGLWQVSGRSDLGEAESMELDLRYIENWNLMLDAGIIWKTGRAVRKANGAY